MKSTVFIISLFISYVSFGQDWTFTLADAKTQAAKEQKNILLVFSGSDWCAPCIKLDDQVWQTAEFKTHAKEKLVLLKADFPKRKKNLLPQVQQDKNNALAEKYNSNGYFPFVVLLNSKGEVINQLGYKNVTATEYIKAIYEN
jgi:thioredoxin-related protein